MKEGDEKGSRENPWTAYQARASFPGFRGYNARLFTSKPRCRIGDFAFVKNKNKEPWVGKIVEIAPDSRHLRVVAVSEA